MPETLLRVAQCSRAEDNNIWELVLTDQRTILVNHGKVKRPGLGWALVGGAAGYAIGFLLTKQDTVGQVGPEVIDALAATPGNIVVPHATVRRATLGRGLGANKELLLECGDPSHPAKVRVWVGAPQEYVHARKQAGLGLLASQKEFIQGFRADLWRVLPPNTIAKDKWG